MKKIKLLRFFSSYTYSECGDSVKLNELVDQTEWTEVSDEDYAILKKAPSAGTIDYKYVLVEELTFDEVKLTIDGMKQHLIDEEKRRIKYEKACKARQEKSKREQEIKTFERLKKKLKGV
jgi:hypothetical protein